jgi:hypothetical protein
MLLENMNKPLGRPRHKWKNTKEMALKGSVDCFQQAKYSVSSREGLL